MADTDMFKEIVTELNTVVTEMTTSNNVSELYENYIKAKDILESIHSYRLDALKVSSNGAVMDYGWLHGAKLSDCFVTFPSNVTYFDYAYKFIGSYRFTLYGKTADGSYVDLFVGDTHIGKLQNNIIYIKSKLDKQ